MFAVARRLAVVLFAVATVTLCLPMSAAAYPQEFSGSFSGQGDSTSRNGGGGSGGVNINDFVFNGKEEIKDRRRLTFDYDWVERAVDISPSCASTGCKTQADVRVPPITAQTGLGTRKATPRGDSEFNSEIFSQVGWRQACAVSGNVLMSNSCTKALSGMTGNNSWAEVHTASPQGSVAPMQGSPAFLSVRIWRSCDTASDDAKFKSGDEGDNRVNATITGSGSKCTVDPLWERVIPYTDSVGTLKDYFSVGNTLRPGSGSTSIAARSQKRQTAGPLYGTCIVSGVGSAANDWCKSGIRSGTRNGATSGAYEQRCHAGQLPDGGRWTSDEIIAQAAMLFRLKGGSNKISKAQRDAVIAWATNGRSGKVFPPVGKEQKKICDLFTEHLQTSWSVSPKTGKVNFKVFLGARPGRIYTIQTVVTDSRENILQQSVQTTFGRAIQNAIPIPGGRCPAGRPDCADPACPPDCGDGGGSEDLDPTERRSVPSGSVMTSLFPSTLIVGQKATGRVVTDPSSMGDDAEAVDGYSIWSPRSLHVTGFNSRYARTGSYNGHTPLVALGGGDQQTTEAGDGHTISRNQNGTSRSIPSGSLVTGKRVPVLTDASGQFMSTHVTVRPPDPTYSPSVRGLTDENDVLRARAKSDQVLYNTLLGESRYSRSWIDRPGGNNIAWQWQRFTCDTVSANGKRPLVEIGSSVSECDPNRTVDGPWKVRDAYYVPRTSGNTQLRLPVLFEHAKDGPVNLKFEVSDPMTLNYLEGLQLFDYDDYKSRAPTDHALMYSNSANLNVCKRIDIVDDVEHRPVYGPVPIPGRVIPHYYVRPGGAWPDVPGHPGYPAGPVGVVQGGNPPYDMFSDYDWAVFDERKWDTRPGVISGWDTAGNPIAMGSDIEFFEYRHSNGSLLHRQKSVGSRTATYDARAGNAKIGNFNLVRRGIWGRDWWYSNEDQQNVQIYQLGVTGTQAVPIQREVPNPNCQDGEAHNVDSNSTDEEGTPIRPTDNLKAGTYVLVAVLNTKGETIPRFNWGVRGRVNVNTESEWINKFDMMQDQGLVQVYRTRAVG